MSPRTDLVTPVSKEQAVTQFTSILVDAARLGRRPKRAIALLERTPERCGVSVETSTTLREGRCTSETRRDARTQTHLEIELILRERERPWRVGAPCCIRCVTAVFVFFAHD